MHDALSANCRASALRSTPTRSCPGPTLLTELAVPRERSRGCAVPSAMNFTEPLPIEALHISRLRRWWTSAGKAVRVETAGAAIRIVTAFLKASSRRAGLAEVPRRRPPHSTPRESAGAPQVRVFCVPGFSERGPCLPKRRTKASSRRHPRCSGGIRRRQRALHRLGRARCRRPVLRELPIASSSLGRRSAGPRTSSPCASS